MIALYLTIDVLLLLLALVLFPKSLCLLLGALGLLAGVVAPLLVWCFGGLFVEGDSSAYGMLGTILIVLFAPPGIGLFIIGLLKRD